MKKTEIYFDQGGKLHIRREAEQKLTGEQKYTIIMGLIFGGLGCHLLVSIFSLLR